MTGEGSDDRELRGGFCVVGDGQGRAKYAVTPRDESYRSLSPAWTRRCLMTRGSLDDRTQPSE